MKRKIEKETFYQASLMQFGKIDYKLIFDENKKDALYLKYKIETYNYPTVQYDIDIALRKLLTMYWLSGGDKYKISGLMHYLGRRLKKLSGCEIPFVNGNYYSDCPNLLLHKDFGFSLRGYEKHKCSICDKDVIDCDHKSGKKYDNIECVSFLGICNICSDSLEVCPHELGVFYNDVEACKVVYDLEIITFDVVKNPKLPLSRVTKIFFSEKDIKRSVSFDKNYKKFKYGETVIECSHCCLCAS